MNRHPIRWPLASGEYSHQAHTDLPAGSFEREMGRDGFDGPACHFHHAHPPTGWSSITGPLRPRAFDLGRLGASQSPWDAPVVLHNGALEARMWHCDGATPLVRNADGDTLLFLHAGRAELYCDWGRLAVTDGDYVLLPRGAMWRLEGAAPLALLLIEARERHFDTPDRALLGPQALFDAAALRVPQIDAGFAAQQGEIPTTLQIKRHGKVSAQHWPFNPLDAIGWHGELCAYALNWRALRPVMSHRYHLPPSVHATFVSDELVVSTFVPRPLESDPGALKLPFFHNNDDFDEFIFYHQGSFMSRDHIHPGMATLHPAGLTHGPHPKAFAVAQAAARPATDEVAVMIDSRQPLTVPALPEGVEWPAYVDSWKTSADGHRG